MSNVSFWDFVSFRPGLSAAELEWKRCLGDSAWAALQTTMFRANGRAPSIHLSPGRVLNVVPMKGGVFNLVCPVTGSVEGAGLTQQDVRLFSLNLNALRRGIAIALNITPEPRPTAEHPRAMPLGTWAPMPARDVHTYLMLPATSALLVSEIRRLLVERNTGFLLFIPGQVGIDSALRGQLERSRAMVLSLTDVLEFEDNGTLRALPTWRTCCDSYRSRYLSEHLVPAKPLYAFSKKGMWQIRFDGKETYLEGTLQGPIFIRYLLQRPDEEIHVARMLADLAGDERIAHASDAGALITKEAIENGRRKHADLCLELAEAEKNHSDRVPQLKAEINDITNYFAECLGLGGKSRKANDDVNRIRKRITRVVEFAFGKIEDHSLATHLRNSIKTGTVMKYEPEMPIDWNFE